MPYSIVIPRLGLTMESARVVQWYKRAGETVARGEVLFSVESDKAVQDIEALASGVVYPLPDLPDEPLPIATVIGYILAPGEALPEGVAAQTAAASPAPATPAAGRSAAASSAPAAATATAVTATKGRKLSSPAARRRAGELGLDWRTLARPDGGPILVATVEQAAQRLHEAGRLDAAPSAAVMAAARAHGLVESVSVEADAGALAPLLDKVQMAQAQRHRPPITWAGWFERIARAAADASGLDPDGLGVYVDERVDTLTLALDPAQVAVMGAGRISQRATEWQGLLALRPRVTLNLTYDRSQLTREVAGQLLDAVRGLVEEPWLLLAYQAPAR